MSEASFSVSDEESSSIDSAVPCSHRALDALRQSPVVELHRSSSGRNLRLKHLSLADEALLSASNSLTPRAPSGRRPGSRGRPDRGNYNSNNEPNSNNDSSLERRSSFSIAAHVLKEIERARSSTDSSILTEINEQPERCSSRQEQREDSSDESDDIRWDASDEVLHNDSDRYSHLDQAVQEEENQAEDKAVLGFGLWNNAVKNKCLPDAIIFSQSLPETSKAALNCLNFASLSNRIDPLEADDSSFIPTTSKMVSQLHVTHPHLAALSVLDMPKAMSLTRSTSPRIERSSFFSVPENFLRRDAAPPTNNQQVDIEVEAISSGRVSNPITQWKRGELIGEGTFGKVYKGLNIITGELFALKEIEIHSCPNVDQITQMQKLGEEISLMNNFEHKHIVRYKGSYRSRNHFYIFMEYVPGGSIARYTTNIFAFSLLAN